MPCLSTTTVVRFALSVLNPIFVARQRALRIYSITMPPERYINRFQSKFLPWVFCDEDEWMDGCFKLAMSAIWLAIHRLTSYAEILKVKRYVFNSLE